MQKPLILVTGAAGQTGSATTRQLLAAGYPVRALVRRRDARSAALEALGAQIAIADMGDPEAMAAALKGVRRAYFLPGYDPALLHQAAVFATAARDEGLEQIVQMTQWLASPMHPALMTRQHWLADRLMTMVPGAAHTLIEPGFFADLPYLATLPYAARLGMWPWPFGDSRNAPPSVEDISAVVVAALQDPARHDAKRYRPTGPELLDGPQMAAILSRVLDRRVRLAHLPFPLFLRAARLDGLPLPMLAMVRHYRDDAIEGAFALRAPTDDVREVTGRAPETFESVARRHAAGISRGLGPTLRQFAKFMLVPMVPPPPVASYLKGLRMPAPAAPASPVNSPIWRSEHRVDGPATSETAPLKAVG
ncbi:NmrA family NAD(P)-binding protein [Qipengyuania qiaonensis]|uniref:NmrA family NAD(P)-binding protein n=1 Tax=Qipengyuania qiaonensis TaxID=2867240 RepID=A0ABS7J467_9SPHN|nr:NmrA family NAD(P)-binding protein [Qipengyuania qiaonensis]MBX7481668.1 NmrA family NAD(P)-binding protein [Qipengyuania qiaonensis]